MGTGFSDRNKIKREYEKEKKVQRSRLGVIVCALIYFFALWLLKLEQNAEHVLLFGNLEVEVNMFKGIVTQFQMLLSVCLVLRQSRTGYMTALALNLIGILITLRYAIDCESVDSVPGTVSYAGVIIIITLIHQFKRRMRHQNHVLMNQYSIIKEKEKELEKMAYFDGLTNVLNRKRFIEELDHRVSECRTTYGELYVVFIDIDNFKTINDTMGHNVGDYVLKEMVNRISTVLYDGDRIGRLGGDELGILSARDISKLEYKVYLEKIREVMIQPFWNEEDEFVVTASFGVANFPECGMDSHELLKKADVAMYHSKKSGKNKILFFGEHLA